MQQLQDAIDPPLEYLFSTLQNRELVRSDIPVTDLIQTVQDAPFGTDDRLGHGRATVEGNTASAATTY